MLSLLAPSMNLVAALLRRRRRLALRLYVVCAILLVAVIGGLVVFNRARPRRFPMSADQAAAAAAAAEAALDAFEKGGGLVPATISVTGLSGDQTGEATAAFRRAIEGRSGLTLLDGAKKPDKGKLERIGRSVADAVGLGGRPAGDVVFSGRLVSATTTDGISSVVVDVSGYDARLKRDVVSGTFIGRYPVVSTALGRSVLNCPRLYRVWVFIATALFLPWLAAPLVRKVRRMKSNAASAVLMAGLFAADALLCSVLFFAISRRLFLFSATMLFFLFYNLAVCEGISRRDG